MIAMATKQQNDPSAHKGAIEGDRPNDDRTPAWRGIDEAGLPDDPACERGGCDRRQRG